MQIIIDSPGRIDAVQLHEELVTAGIAIGPINPVAPVFMRDGERFTVVVPDGTDPEAVRRVIATHTPGPEPTPVQIKQDRVAATLDAADEPGIFRKALVLTLVDLQNDNAARIAARQNLRTITPKQLADAIRANIDSLTE